MTDHWEYKTFNFHEVGFLTGKLDMPQLENMLNEFGREGWELASTSTQGARFGRGTYGLIVILKRPR